MQRYRILWVDDEIELLKPYVLFLKEKGFDVKTFNNPFSLLDHIKIDKKVDIILLDENMPGLTGIGVLSEINKINSFLPVIMITKNEEENIMNEAIGNKISDYLIKPLNPNQIFISIKRVLENNKIVSENLKSRFTNVFSEISNSINKNMQYSEWVEIYKNITSWEIELDKYSDANLFSTIKHLKDEANFYFFEFVKKNYQTWLSNPSKGSPLMSNNLMKELVFPNINNENFFFILIDNLRLDQWLVLKPMILESFLIQTEGLYCSILPTTTEYARNSIFSSLLPIELSNIEKDLWVGQDNSLSGKNNNEYDLLKRNLKRQNIDIKFSYSKIINHDDGKKLLRNLPSFKKNNLNVIVFNFVDMLSHARTEMEMIKNLAYDESSYRSLTLSWFNHSVFKKVMDFLSHSNHKIVLTTDHGTIRVKKPIKIKGDRNTNSNLRYKSGKNLSFNEKNLFFTREPEKLFLPKQNISSSYVFANENKFFVYPNNYNSYVKSYKDSFQHGGISLEEMFVPYSVLEPKN